MYIHICVPNKINITQKLIQFLYLVKLNESDSVYNFPPELEPLWNSFWFKQGTLKINIAPMHLMGSQIRISLLCY